jgi:hypothetical protein
LLRARSQLGRRICGWRRLLLCVGASFNDDATAWRLAAPAGVPHLPTPRPSRCSRGHDPGLWLWAFTPEGPNSSVLTFAVDGLADLEHAVIPFFERYPPVVKQRDFEAFSYIVRSMRRKEHLSRSGFEHLVRLAYGMNANGKQRARTLEQVLAGPSETARGAHQPARASG